MEEKHEEERFLILQTGAVEAIYDAECMHVVILLPRGLASCSMCEKAFFFFLFACYLWCIVELWSERDHVY